MVRPVAVAVLVAAAVLCGEAGATTGTPRRRRGREVVARQQTQFGLDMYSLLAREQPSANIFFSPLSIGTALAMVYAGSRGETAQQMETVLRFSESRKRTSRGHRGLLRWMQKRYRLGGVTVKMTNRVYASEQLRMRRWFAALVQRLYGAKVRQVDFGEPARAAAIINENVSSDTEGHITELVNPGMLANAVLAMVNAVFFKGAWLMQFERNRTFEADFHSPSGTRTVQMMRTEKQFPVGYVGSLDARMLKLPYKGEDISMLILLPNEQDGIYQLDARINSSLDLGQLLWSLDSDQDVEVQLPRFKMEEQIDLKDTLKKMGMTDLFDQNEANLRGITRREQLFVSCAVHKAGIDVTEEGTTATAATAIGFSFRMLRPEPEPFIVNRPFFFVLRDERTGATLFIGRVMEP